METDETGRRDAGGPRIPMAMAVVASWACGGPQDFTIPAGTIELADKAPGEIGFGPVDALTLELSCKRPVGFFRRLLDWQTISFACDGGFTANGTAFGRSTEFALQRLGPGRFEVEQTAVHWNGAEGSMCATLRIDREELAHYCSDGYVGDLPRPSYPLSTFATHLSDPVKIVKPDVDARWQVVLASERVAEPPPKGAVEFCHATVTPTLTELDCQHPVDDLAPLAGLRGSQLTELTLDGKYRDLAPLAGLTEVRDLTLFSDEVQDLTPLGELTKLRELSIRGASDLTPLGKLSNLEVLKLHGAQVTDLGPLAGLGNLRELWASETGVADLTPLRDLPKLEFLWVTETNVTDLAPIASVRSLRTLRISRTQVSDLSALSGLTELESLFLVDTPVDDLTPLEDLTKLEILNISGTNVSDISVLSNLANLGRLEYEGSKVQDADYDALKKRLPKLGTLR